MSKYIEITYPDQKAEEKNKYKGLNSRYPDIFLDSSESPALSNIWLRNDEIRSAPPWQFVFQGPEPTNPCLGQASFLDGNGQIHTVAFTSRGLFQLNPFNSNPGLVPWTYVGGPSLALGTPVSSRVFANLLYYTNGNTQVTAWDGLTPATTLVSGLTSSIFGGAGSSLGGVYMYELNDQLCILNVTLFNAATTGSTPAGSTTSLPQRLWYSANGVLNQFDPTVNTSAGFVDFPEVPDIFTGVLALGEVAYMFRSNGITEQTITGNALAPFYYNHLWASERGIGSVYPWSIAQYGGVGFFISTEDVYRCSVYEFTPIGEGARDAIIADLANATQNPVASVVPSYGYGYTYLRYELCIPLGTFTRVYSFSLEGKSWEQQDLAGYIVTARPSVCWR